MPFDLSWHTQDRVLLLSISGNYTLEDAQQANKLLLDRLEQSTDNLILVVDVLKMRRPYNFQMIRDTQKYMDHLKLKQILVIASDKLIKLTMMVIFHFAHAQVRVLDDLDTVNTLIERQSYS